MKIIDYLKTLVPVSTLLFFSLQKNNGFLSLLLFAFITVILINLVRMIWIRGEGKKFLIRLGIWTAALILAGSMQGHWSNISRINADIAAKAVLAYKTRTGTYPDSLKAVGLDGEQLHTEWGIRYFVRKDGQVVLTYPATFMPLTTFDYDFENRKWIANAY